MKGTTSKGTVTITFGDVAENHVGMQKIGEMSTEGFSFADLESAKSKFESLGSKCELISLNDSLPAEHSKDSDPSAAILIVRAGVDLLLGKDSKSEDLLKEQLALKWDTKSKMYGRVVNKKARHNLCFADEGQPPDYEAGKGRIVAYSDVPLLDSIRARLDEFLGEKAKGLMAEGNLYYDTKNCGIGFHGDAERRKVVAIRLGESLPLHYQWFLRGASIGERVKLILNHGDLYVMGDRATGNNWKLKKIPTLRHAAGAKRFLTIKKKKETAPLKGKEKKRKEDVPAVKATKKRKSVKKSIFKIDKED